MARGNADPALRTLTTPEGVLISVHLADRSTRAGAFLLDVLIVSLTVIVLFLAFGLTLRPTGPGLWMASGVMIIVFLVRSCYFVFFEARWRGATPGKRMMGIRMVDRSGQHLSTEAVIARNLMREVEFFMPMTLLLVVSFGGENQWTTLATLAWTLIFLFMPMFNRDRLRAGDIIGGTWVVVTPRAALLRDIADANRDRIRKAPDVAFTTEQLDVYGEYELQTLEEVLRMNGAGSARWESEVARRIQRRIKWRAQVGRKPTDRVFLEAFYAALRGHLEQKMLFGERRADKYHRTHGNNDKTNA